MQTECNYTCTIWSFTSRASFTVCVSRISRPQHRVDNNSDTAYELISHDGQKKEGLLKGGPSLEADHFNAQTPASSTMSLAIFFL